MILRLIALIIRSRYKWKQETAYDKFYTHHASIPFNTVTSVYFQPMIDVVASIGVDYKGPNFHAIRGYLIAKNVEETKKNVDSYQ